MQTWLEIPESENVTALSVWNQYVVSHRPSRFTLSYRPDGSHVHVGVFPSLEDAKQAAVEHSRTAEQ